MVKDRKVGLHIRLTSTLIDVLERAKTLKSSIVQCFFVHQVDTSYVSFAPGELEKTIALLKENFSHAYLHGSYWINLPGKRNNGARVFKRELELAQTLGFTHMILHAGSAKSCETKQEGIELLAKALNKAMAQPSSVTLMLENTAHGNMSIGGDIKDFKVLLGLLDHPDKIEFCLDSAHAYSYGYDISTAEGLEAFIAEVDDAIGCHKVTLLHLNDIHDCCGSRIDKHMMPGEGKIGLEALKRFMNHPKLKHASVILEIPAVTNEEEKKILKTVRGWTK